MIESLKLKKSDLFWEPFAGSGVVSLFAAHHVQHVFATDLNPHAIENTKQNFEKYGLKDKLSIFQSDVFPPVEQSFDVIALNPPYTDKEAEDNIEIMAWDHEHKALKKFFSGVRNYLKANGSIYISWPDYSGFQMLEHLMQKHGFQHEVVSEVSEPLDKKNPASSQSLVYRVYKAHLPIEKSLD